MFGLVGYVALLAVSACFLVRVGKVWDDVRSLLPLIVLMCLAISVCFDDALATSPNSGVWYYVAGFLFTAVVSEGVLFGMPLRLPAVFRVPYYLIVALFFFYPVLLSPLIPHPDDPRLHWGLFAFSSAAGLAFLTLLPAARRGPRAIAENAAPWPWPWYPWVLFGVLALGVLGRACYLCISLHFVVGNDSIFAAYFWVPFLLALNVLLLELLASVRRPVVLPCLIALPVALLAMSVTYPGKAPVYLDFANTLTSTIGATPLFCTVVAIAGFYGYCILRRVPHAVDILSGGLILFCFVGRSTYGPTTVIEPIGLPFAFIALIQIVAASCHRNALRGLLATGCVLIAAAIQFRDSLVTAGGGLVAFHLLLAVILVAGVLLRGRLGRSFQYTGAALLAAVGTAAVFLPATTLGSRFSPQFGALLPVYPYSVAALAVSYGYLVSNFWCYGSAVLVLGSKASGLAWGLYLVLKRTIDGLDYLVFGFLFFLVAIVISLSKAGLLRNPWRRTLE